MYGMRFGQLGTASRTPSLAERVTRMFASGEQGAWYDPSDMSTLFQDAAGTTPVTAVEQPVGLMLDLSGRGNHATQATTTKRPVLSRRVNLLTKTEQFDDAVWQKSRCSVTSNAVVGPDGLMSADKVIADTQSNPHFISTTAAHKSGTTCRISVYAKAGEWDTVMLFGANNTVGGRFDLSLGSYVSNVIGSPIAPTITPVGGGWYLLALSFVTTADNQGVSIRITPSGGDSSVPGNGVAGLYLWGADSRSATDAHLPYQRVNTATDYDADPAKFPAYRKLDGVDDSHVSATGGGGTAGFFFSASVTPQGGAGTARTLFSDAGTNTGYIVRLNASNQLELAAGNGTAYTTVATSGTLAVGTTDVVQAWDDGTNLNVKIGNGATASVARPAVSAGTAGYTMGQDNGASTGYFNGRVYSTIYRKDSGLTQVQRESVALHQRQKARMP